MEGPGHGETGAEGDFCTGTPSSERVPFDAYLGFPAAFVNLKVQAIKAGRVVKHPYRRVTHLLSKTAPPPTTAGSSYVRGGKPAISNSP